MKDLQLEMEQQATELLEVISMAIDNLNLLMGSCICLFLLLEEPDALPDDQLTRSEFLALSALRHVNEGLYVRLTAQDFTARETAWAARLAVTAALLASLTESFLMARTKHQRIKAGKQMSRLLIPYLIEKVMILWGMKCA